MGSWRIVGGIRGAGLIDVMIEQTARKKVAAILYGAAFSL
jgi:hypothetical protein